MRKSYNDVLQQIIRDKAQLGGTQKVYTDYEFALLPGRVTGVAKGRAGSLPVCFGSPGRAILKAHKRLGSPLLSLGIAREMPRCFGYLIQHFCYLAGTGAVFVRAAPGASYGPLPDDGV